MMMPLVLDVSRCLYLLTNQEVRRRRTRNIICRACEDETSANTKPSPAARELFIFIQRCMASDAFLHHEKLF